MAKPGSPLDSVRRQIYLGDRRFLAEMSERAEKDRRSLEIPALQREPLPVEIEEIRRVVCAEWRLEPAELNGREAGDAKLAAIYLARRLCGKSAREVGEAFGIKRGRVTNVMVEVHRKRRTYLRQRVEKIISNHWPTRPAT
jgi:chromosomal replication initiation ATPase DnaA